MASGKRDRRAQFQRAGETDDGFTTVETPHADYGNPVWASKTDIQDAERWRAGAVGATISTRFEINSSEFTRGLTPKDRLICDGVSYNISGIKESGGRRKRLEITASTRAV